MSYIEIEIGGKKRGLKFNQLAVELYAKKTDWERHTDASEVYATFYAGLMGNCTVKQEEPDFNFENVCDWVDDLASEEKVNVMHAFAECKKFKEWIQRVNDRLEEEKAKTEEGELIKKNGT